MEGGRAAAPDIGTLVNRFKAMVPDNFPPEVCEQAVGDAWRRLADRVCERFVRPVAATGEGGAEGVRHRWTRQIDGFWEISWVMTDEVNTNAWLDMRKNWRSHFLAPEGGDHCMLMGDYQELSGWLRSRANERQRQAEFWDALRKETGDDSLDLGTNERLCAIALVKRLFPALPDEDLVGSIGWVPGGDRRRIRNWPSTRYMAVLPWLVRPVEPGCVALCMTDPLKDHAKLVRSKARMYWSEHRPTRLPGVPDTAVTPATGLDGGLWCENEIENPNSVVLKPDQDRTDLSNSLTRCLKAVQATYGIGKPSPYYTLLLMDGDRLGELSAGDGEAVAATALARFADHVTEIVGDHDGVTIYAGGDDVLALLPLTRAVRCAHILRAAYAQAFTASIARHDVDMAAGTISGAVVFAEAGVPLRLVMETAHHLLDDLAKEGNGRDSLALCVLKPGGKTLDWVSTWESEGCTVFDELAARRSHEPALTFSSSFFYNMRTRYQTAVFDCVDTFAQMTEDTLLALVATELDKNRSPTAGESACERRERTLGLARDLIAVCRETRGPGATFAGRPAFSLDGALLLRFLAREGHWPAEREETP